MEEKNRRRQEGRREGWGSRIENEERRNRNEFHSHSQEPESSCMELLLFLYLSFFLLLSFLLFVSHSFTRPALLSLFLPGKSAWLFRQRMFNRSIVSAGPELLPLDSPLPPLTTPCVWRRKHSTFTLLRLLPLLSSPMALYLFVYLLVADTSLPRQIHR